MTVVQAAHISLDRDQPDRFDQVVAALSWPQRTSTFTELWTYLLELLCVRLGHALGEIGLEDERLGRELVAQMRKLDNDALFRVVAAPETSFRLLHSPDGQLPHAGYYARAMRAERYRANIRRDEACWTALADRYYAATRTPRAAVWRPEADYAAPVLSHGVPVDHTSPLVRELDSMPGDFEPLTASELTRILDDLQRGVDGVAATSDTACQLITLFTRVVLLRRDPTSPTQFGSSSTSTHIGRAAFGNPQLGDAAQFANGFVHEAIHTAFYVVEIEQPMVVDRRFAEAKVVSPWTGNSLRLRTFLHACLVWFGLYKFWYRVLQQRTFSETAALDQLRRALVGFTGVELVDLLAPLRSAISPIAFDAIERLQQEVRHDGEH